MKPTANLANKKEVLELLKILYGNDETESTDTSHPARMAGTEFAGGMANVSPDIEELFSQDE